MVGLSGSVYAFGDVPYKGGTNTGSVVDIEPTRSGEGYWIATSLGGVLRFGDAPDFGDAHDRLRAGEHVVSMSATPNNDGYWLFTDIGRVIPFGAAPFLGDMAAVKLNGPVLGSVATPTGHGYYMVASDGGVFSFGDAVFHGSMGGTRLNQPVMGLVPDADNVGYWLVARDGGVFAFAAPFRGSMGGSRAEPSRDRHGRFRHRLPDGRVGRRHLQLLRQAVPRFARLEPARRADRLDRGSRRAVSRIPRRGRRDRGTITR